MEEIQVGEYVRTKYGKIRKLISTLAQYYILEKINIEERNQYELEDIASHSFNIIDLIEVEDYVNGDKIIDVGGAWKDNLETVTIIEGETMGEITEIDIKSIVTKEQFSDIEYKVGEE